MVEWDDLRFFLAISRAGTMSGAAQALKVNQTTVGRRLGALEEKLGVLLFDRTPAGLRVSDAGRKIVVIASEMEEASLSLERLVAGSDERLEGVVRIACSETLAVGFVIEGLAAFRAAHPHITLDIVTGNSPLNLLRREADLAIRTKKPPHSDLMVRKLVDADWCLYAAAVSAPHDPGDSLDEREVVGYEGELVELPASQWLHERVPPERIAARCNSILGAAAAIRAGLGVGALPAFVGDRADGLRRFLPDAITSQPLWLAVHPDLEGQARVRAALDYLVGLFAKNSHLFRAASRPARTQAC
jgi:DNA-binding transcriptional LysR family regulator